MAVTESGLGQKEYFTAANKGLRGLDLMARPGDDLRGVYDAVLGRTLTLANKMRGVTIPYFKHNIWIGANWREGRFGGIRVYAVPKEPRRTNVSAKPESPVGKLEVDKFNQLPYDQFVRELLNHHMD